MIRYSTTERLDSAAYIDFLGRSGLGSEYPRKEFAARIATLLENADICVTARTGSGRLVGVCLALTDFTYFIFLTDLGVDREFERQGIGRELVRLVHRAAGGEADISMITWANSGVAPFYESCGLRRLDWALGKDATDWEYFDVGLDSSSLMADRTGTQLENALSSMRSDALQSLLLAVFRERTRAQRPRDVREAFKRRFCRPSDANPRTMHEIDSRLFAAASEFELIELSPLAPLGVCTAVAPCDPIKVVASVRNLEVVSDPSNVLAVEAAERRRAGAGESHLAASQRVVRAQAIAHPDHRAHFRLFVLCSMFPSRGSGRAESAALLRHLQVYREAVEQCGARLTRLSVSCRGQPWEAVRDCLADESGLPVDAEDDRIDTNNYYLGLSFKAHVQVPTDEVLPLGDGGFTSWGARYLSRSRERTLVTAIGTELLAKKLDSWRERPSRRES